MFFFFLGYLNGSKVMGKLSAPDTNPLKVPKYSFDLWKIHKNIHINIICTL